MRKRNVSYSEKMPKQITMQKVKLIDPNSSPTVSPIKRVKKFVYDRYTVNVPEDLTLIREDLPFYLPTACKILIKTRDLANESPMVDPRYVPTESSDYQTPTIEFKPHRPKRFCP